MAIGVVYFSLGFAFPAVIGVFLLDGQDGTVVAAETSVLVLSGVAVRVAPYLAGAVACVWIVSLAYKAQRRALLRRARDLEAVRSLSWQQFELLVGEYYRGRGFEVEEWGGASPDGGIDLVLRKGGRTCLVQCKHWRARKVGVGAVRELLGVMAHFGISEGTLVTSGQLSADARLFAEKNGISLVDGAALVAMIRVSRASASSDSGVSDKVRPPAAATLSCPSCGAPMVLRAARNGPNAGSRFYGCQRYPACRGVRPWVAG